jgi:hypothetical protein
MEPGARKEMSFVWRAHVGLGVGEPRQPLPTGPYIVVGGVSGEPDLLTKSAPDTVWVSGS